MKLCCIESFLVNQQENTDGEQQALQNFQLAGNSILFNWTLFCASNLTGISSFEFDDRETGLISHLLKKDLAFSLT